MAAAERRRRASIKVVPRITPPLSQMAQGRCFLFLRRSGAWHWPGTGHLLSQPAASAAHL